MDVEKEKKKRSSSKSKENDHKQQSSGKKDDKTSKRRSDSKERNEEKIRKTDKKHSKEAVNGHVNEKEHRSRDDKKQTKDNKQHRDDKIKPEQTTEKRNESKDRKEPKNADSKIKTKIPTREVEKAANESTDKKAKRNKQKEENDVKPSSGSDKSKKSSQAHAENGYEEKENKPKPTTASSKRSKTEEDDYNYEEDFEDYEEDFEEEEFENDDQNENEQSDNENDKKFEEVTKRVIVQQTEPEPEETKRVVSKNGNASRASNESRPSTVQSRIDFSKAKYSELQMASHGKLRRRERELLGLIELDITTYDLFDLAPIRDYEFFIQNFGKSNMKQVQLQTDDDAIERELQTDEIDMESKWTQHPPTDLTGCGGYENVANVTAENKFQIDTELFNSTRFRRFVEKGGKLIFELLDDIGSSAPSLANKANMSISDGYSTMSLGLLSKQCHTSYVLIAPDNPHLLLTAFFVYESPAEDIVNKNVVCLWNSNKLDMPQKIMLCNNDVKCACFSPGIPTAIFAGLNDGSLVAWDLHESEALHKSIPWNKDELPLRIPTYDTAFLLKENNQDSHAAPLVAVTSLESSAKQSANSNTYQIAALEETGLITIWTVLISVVNELLEMDLGLSPGGRLKLVKSATLKPSTGSMRSLGRLTCQCFCMGYSFGRPLDFYVGTDTGYVLHSVRHETKSGPSVYKPELEAIADVLCLQFSPFEPSVLLAGLSDGSIYLYKTNLTKPLGVFQINNNSDSVKSIQWSPNSPYIFYSLHGNTVIAVWDLKHNKQAPVQIEKTKPIASLSISTWIYSDDVTSSVPYMILACADGTAEVHCLKTSSSGKYSKNDGQKLLMIVERL